MTDTITMITTPTMPPMQQGGTTQDTEPEQPSCEPDPVYCPWMPAEVRNHMIALYLRGSLGYSDEQIAAELSAARNRKAGGDGRCAGITAGKEG